MVTRRGFALSKGKSILLIALVAIAFSCGAQLYLSTSISWGDVQLALRGEQEEEEVLPVESFPVEFVPTHTLGEKDIFAASWWQTMERFMPLDMETIQNVEGDAFKPILLVGRGRSDARMAVDWLDFSIEHLSKWWKLAGETIHPYVIQKLEKYVRNTLSGKFQARTSEYSMNTTLALVPLGVKADEAVWEMSLTATLASLLKHGVGRIVVVGHYDADVRLARKVFENLRQYYYTDASNIVNGTSAKAISMQLGDSTELAYVHTDDVKSKFIAVNVPRGALKGLQEAWLGKRPQDATDWLGSTSWKYLYFTESDQILNARLSHEFFQLMDEGCVIVPHRLQPIPHWGDLQQFWQNSTFFVPMVPQAVLQDMTVHNLMAANTRACCDAGLERPARPDWCQNFWWQCGFAGKKNPNGRFDYLREYGFARFSTGIVHLTGTEQGRRCLPKRRGECIPKNQSMDLV